LLSTTASSSSSNINRLYLDEEAILFGKLNSRVIRVDEDDRQNKKGFAFLAFCDNDQRRLTKGCTVVCLYNNTWHCVHYNSKDKPYLGAPQPNVHFYDEDIKLPIKSNVDTDEEAPTKKRGSESPSEEEIQEPLLKDFTIRHASIDPSVLTPNTQSPSASHAELPEEPDPLWNHPRLAAIAALQLRRRQVVAAQTATMTTQAQTTTTSAPAASASVPAASGSANLTIYE
jgi:hypothetical protein